MKKLALIVLCGVASVALSAEEFTIQTISALKESSITPAFEKKIKKTGIPYIKKTEGDRHVVLLGSYKKTKDAKPDTKKVRMTVTHDAFVRPMERGGAIATTAATTEKGPVVTVQVQPEAVKTVADSAHAAPVAVAVPSSAVAAVAVEKKEDAAVNCPAPAPKVALPGSETVVIYDRNAMRKNDISEAIEYYKNSPYYSFRSVPALR